MLTEGGKVEDRDREGERERDGMKEDIGRDR